ncbi:hypothetical protein HDU84_007995 [Entophlyctis sp. JEL0112]|nr:hypothetical protein HDU84_007995 [Entophlyctis sp. JEL0112]
MGTKFDPDSLSEIQQLQKQLETQNSLISTLRLQYSTSKVRTLQLVQTNKELIEIIKSYSKMSEELRKLAPGTYLALVSEIEKLLTKYRKANPEFPEYYPPPDAFQRTAELGISVSGNTVSDIVVFEQLADQKSSALLSDHHHLSALLLFPLFSQFPKSVVEEISSRCFETKRRAGQFIVKKGDKGAEIFFLIEGTLAVIVDGKAVSTLQPITFFGELGLLLETYRTATVVAKTDCTIIVVTKITVDSAVAQSMQARAKLAEFASNKEDWWNRHKYVQGHDKFGAEFSVDLVRPGLSKLEVFASAPDPLLDMLAMAIRYFIYERGQLVVKMDDPSEAIYFMHYGTVEVVGRNGEVHAELTAGAFFGEVGVLLNVPRSASIRAKTENVYAFALFKQEMDSLVCSYPVLKEMLNSAAKERMLMVQKQKKEKAADTNDENVVISELDMEIAGQSLAKIGMFKKMEKSVMSELALKMIRKSWGKGENIVTCGDRGESMFFLAAGTANVVTEFGEVIDSVSGPNAYFGEVAIIELVPRTATVQCTSPCSTYELRKKDFSEVLDRYPDMRKQVFDTAEERMQKVECNITVLAVDPAFSTVSW